MNEQEIHQAAMCAEHAYCNYMLREMKSGSTISPREFGKAAAEAYMNARHAIESAAV